MLFLSNQSDVPLQRCAVDGADVREPRHWMEWQFVVDQWLLVSGKLDVVGSNFDQWIGYSFHGKTDRRLRQTTAATDHPLEAARREELEGGEQLRIGRNGVMSACRSLKFQQFHHGRARKTRALKELVFRHIVHSQKTITYLLLRAKQRIKMRHCYSMQV